MTSVAINYQTGTLNGQDKGDNWSYTKDQGVTYRLTITLILKDGHNAIVWNSTYTTKSGQLYSITCFVLSIISIYIITLQQHHI